MYPTVPRQVSSNPRDFIRATGTMGSLARYASLRTKTAKTTTERISGRMGMLFGADKEKRANTMATVCDRRQLVCMGNTSRTTDQSDGAKVIQRG